MWQDWVLMIGGFGFCIALLPTVFSKDKPHWKTSLLTTLILASGIPAYATLGLWKAVAGSSITTLLWGILLVQEVNKNRRKDIGKFLEKTYLKIVTKEERFRKN